MNEWLSSLVQSQELPWLSAFALGLLTAISPCPLATNITATAFIARGFRQKRIVVWSGLFYLIGRTFSYMVLALVLYLGASKFHLARFFQGNGEKWLGPLLLIIGLIMLNVIPIKIDGGNLLQRFTDKIGKQGILGAFALGMIFALAFCPYSGALYFGMLVPMTLRSAEPFSMPLLFSLGAGLPVLLFTYLLAFSMEKISAWFRAIQNVEKVARYAAGGVFVLVGLYYLFIFFN